MPTIRQKKAFAKTLENGGVVSTAMLEADYSRAMAKNPQKLTESKGWKELMDKHLPDNLLAKKHREGLEAVTNKPHLVDRDDKGRPVYEYMPEDDYSTRHKYLDSAYKLKGSYAPEKSVNLNLNADARNLNPKVLKLKEEYEKKLLETIQND